MKALGNPHSEYPSGILLLTQSPAFDLRKSSEENTAFIFFIYLLYGSIHCSVTVKTQLVLMRKMCMLLSYYKAIVMLLLYCRFIK